MKTVKQRSQKQEKSVAKTLNAKTTVASGAFWQSKGDCRSDKFLVECKTTKKDYYCVTTKVWEKIREEALKDRMRTPLLVVDLRDKNRYVIFNPQHFRKPLEHVEVFSKNEAKTFRLMEGISALVQDIPLTFKLSPTRGIIHNLAVMCEKQFLDYYKEEIFND